MAALPGAGKNDTRPLTLATGNSGNAGILAGLKRRKREENRAGKDAGAPRVWDQLEQRIEERRQWRAGAENQEQAQHQQDDNQRQKPPFFFLAQEQQEFFEDLPHQPLCNPAAVLWQPKGGSLIHAHGAERAGMSRSSLVP